MKCLPVGFRRVAPILAGIFASAFGMPIEDHGKLQWHSIVFGEVQIL
jgi:hypothetical protein